MRNTKPIKGAKLLPVSTAMVRVRKYSSQVELVAMNRKERRRLGITKEMIQQ